MKRISSQQMVVLAISVVIIGAIAVVAITHKSKTNSSSSASGSTSTTATDKVSISNFAFNPTSITVKAGATVVWTNTDSVNHSVTSDMPSADSPSSRLLSQGQNFSFTFKKAGTYTYHCSVHPDMHGTVIVTN